MIVNVESETTEKDVAVSHCK